MKDEDEGPQWQADKTNVWPEAQKSPYLLLIPLSPLKKILLSP